MHSETLNDDNGVPVAKRCILLLGGENDEEELAPDNAHPMKKKEAIMRNNGIFLNFSANALADPTAKRKADV